MSLYEGAVKKPIMTSLCFLAVVIFGLFSLSKLPIDLYPDIDTNTIMVMTAYPGASASDIENNVTRPLENVLNSVSDLKHITSRSSENMSLITLEFEYGYDTYRAAVRTGKRKPVGTLQDTGRPCGKPSGAYSRCGYGVYQRCAAA